MLNHARAQLAGAALVLLLLTPALAQRHAADRPFEEDKLAMLPELIKEAGALAKKNEHARARMIAWAVWSQCYAERAEINYRYQSKRNEHAKRIARVAAIEASLAEAVYGPTPTFKADADVVEVMTALKLGQTAMAAKNYSLALEVVKLVGTRVKAGLKLDQAQADAVNGFFKQYREQAKGGFAHLTKQHFNVVKVVGRRGKAGSPEQRLLTLWRNHKYLAAAGVRSLQGRDGKFLISSHRIYRGLMTDMAKGERALLALCQDVVDPGYGKYWVASALKNARKKRNRAYEQQILLFLSNVRAIVFWKRLCAKWSYPEHIGKAWLKYVAGCLLKSERAFQNDNTEQGRHWQKEAGEGLKLAAQMKAPAAGLAQRKAQVAALEGLVGAGKLKRAAASLARAEAVMKSAATGTATDLDEAISKVATAATWIEKSKAEGATPAALAPLEQRLQRADAALPATWAKMTQRDLKEAATYAKRAEAQWAKGEDAYLAGQHIDRALKYLGRARSFLPQVTSPPFDAAQLAVLKREVAQAETRLGGMKAETVRRQRHPKDVYTGGSANSWRRQFRALAGSRWTVKALSIVNADWEETESRYEYGKYVEIRFNKELYAWAALVDPANPKRLQLRCLGFRLHKYTDGSYRNLKMFYVGRAIPMLAENLK